MHSILNLDQYRPPRSSLLGEQALQLLDHIDYGLVVVDAVGHVLFCNRPAHACLDHAGLALIDGRLTAPGEMARRDVALALGKARLGRRCILDLHPMRSGVSVVAFIPLRIDEADRDDPATLLVFGKDRSCEPVSLELFSLSCGLTPAETQVLRLLTEGCTPAVVAARLGVAVSTIRTQIGSARAKTNATSIRELIRRVSMLPPIVHALIDRKESYPLRRRIA